jgi:hypothetical protein
VPFQLNVLLAIPSDAMAFPAAGEGASLALLRSPLKLSGRPARPLDQDELPIRIPAAWGLCNEKLKCKRFAA